MAHVAKYTRGSVGGLTSHFERRKDENGEYYKFKNQDIDYAKTHLNYNLGVDQDQRVFVKDRLAEVKCLNREDVKVMCSWVVTAPKNLKENEYEPFFKSTYDFLSKRYGENNVISSYVHMDEVTPHMHFAFIPVTIDKKKNIEKVSAKEVLNKRELQVFHDQFSLYINKIFNRDVGILNEATKDGNKSIQELKRGTALAEHHKITQQTQTLVDAGKRLQESIKDTEHRISDLEGVFSDKEEKLIIHYEEKKKALESKLNGLQTQVKGTQLKLDEILAINPQKGIMGGIKGVTLKEIENLKRTALVASRALAENKELSQERDALKDMVKKLKEQVPSVADKLKEVKEKSVLQEKARAFDSLPDDIKRQILSKPQNKSNIFEHER